MTTGLVSFGRMRSLPTLWRRTGLSVFEGIELFDGFDGRALALLARHTDQLVLTPGVTLAPGLPHPRGGGPVRRGGGQPRRHHRGHVSHAPSSAPARNCRPGPRRHPRRGRRGDRPGDRRPRLPLGGRRIDGFTDRFLAGETARVVAGLTSAPAGPAGRRRPEPAWWPAPGSSQSRRRTGRTAPGDIRDDDQGRHHHALRLAGAREGHVHAVVAGDQRAAATMAAQPRPSSSPGSGGSRAGLVVGIDQRAHQVAQRVGGLVHHDHVVVQVLPVGQHDGSTMSLAAHQPIQGLRSSTSRWNFSPARRISNHSLAGRAAADARRTPPARYLVVVGVELPEGVEVAVDDVVEQRGNSARRARWPPGRGFRPSGRSTSMS